MAEIAMVANHKNVKYATIQPIFQRIAMKSKIGRTNYSSRKFAPPKATNPDKSRQQWNQRNAEARAVEARERAEERQEKNAQESES